MFVATYLSIRRKIQGIGNTVNNDRRRIAPVSCRHRPDASRNGSEAAEPRECPACKLEKRAFMKYRFKIILGLIIPYCLQSLDVTIVASALPWIAVDFGQVYQLNWIISVFNLTSAAFIPFWGQIADIFGRHWALQSTFVLMLIGSALCFAAPTNSFAVLLLGRAIQGVACAGIDIIVGIVLADKVSLEESARNWTAFALTGGMSFGFGPIVGGYLTAVNWRWCFGINLPIAFVAIFITFFVLQKEMLGPQSIPGLDENGTDRHQRFMKRISTIDAGGQILFLLGFGLLILALTWAGVTYNWNSAAVIISLILGMTIISGFLLYEYLMIPGHILSQKLSHQTPMLPWKLLQNRNISLLLYVNIATGMAMYSVLYFCDIYFTMVKLYDSSKAGIQLLFYTPGLGVGGFLSMFFCNLWPRQTFLPLFLGSIIEAVGVGMLAWALHLDKTSVIYGMMALTGVGTGLRMMPGRLHAIAFFPNDIATVVSLMGISIPLGGTLALTIMSTVFNNTSGIAEDSPLRDFSTLSQLPPEHLAGVISSAKSGITWAFVAITPFLVICILVAACLGNVTIVSGANVGINAEEGRGAHLKHGSYLLALLKGDAVQRDITDGEK